MAMTRAYYSVNGRILGEASGGTRLDYMTDALGSVTGTVDSSAQVVNTYRYKPFGSLLARTGTGADPKFRWVGTEANRRSALRFAEVFSQRAESHYAELLGLFGGVSRPSAAPYSHNPSGQIPPESGSERVHIAVKTALAQLPNPGRGLGELRIVESSLTCKPSAILASVSPGPCTARCYRNWHPSSWLCGLCDYHLQTVFNLSYKPGKCTDCRIYQFVDEVDDGKGWIKDRRLGWPYPQSCMGSGEKRICSTFDQPTDRGWLFNCNRAYFDQTELVTCLCCDKSKSGFRFNECYKWGYIHALLPHCKPYCDRWGPRKLPENEAKKWCKSGI